MCTWTLTPCPGSLKNNVLTDSGRRPRAEGRVCGVLVLFPLLSLQAIHPGLHSCAQSRPSGPPQRCTEQAIRACHSCARSRPAWPEVAFQRPLLLLSCLVMSSSLQPHGYSPPVPSVCGGQEYWSGSPFPSLGDLPDPGIKEAVSPVSSSLQTDSLPAEPPLANSKQLFLEARRSRLWAEWAPGQGIVSGS